MFFHQKAHNLFYGDAKHVYTLALITLHWIFALGGMKFFQVTVIEFMWTNHMYVL